MADKVYIATLTQSSTNAPVATELANTVGTVTWARTGSGVYTATVSGAFSPVASTTVLMPVMTAVTSVVVTDVNTVTLTCSGDGVLSAREISIVVSTYYCTFRDLENKISRKTLAQLTSETANGTIGSPSVVDFILSNVNAKIDAKAGQVYEVPFTTIPDIIKRIAIDIACYEVMLRRPVTMAMPGEWKSAYDDAIKQLDDISNMLLRLPSTATVESSESDIVTDDVAIDRISFTDTDSENLWQDF